MSGDRRCVSAGHVAGHWGGDTAHPKLKDLAERSESKGGQVLSSS